jgi:hypothetical protein
MLTLSELPCLTCSAPQAADIRHALGQGAFDDGGKTPHGLPLGCCRIEMIGSVLSGPIAECPR